MGENFLLRVLLLVVIHLLVRLLALHSILYYDFLLFFGDDNFFDLVVFDQPGELFEVATDAMREDRIDDFYWEFASSE